MPRISTASWTCVSNARKSGLKMEKTKTWASRKTQKTLTWRYQPRWRWCWPSWCRPDERPHRWAPLRCPDPRCWYQCPAWSSGCTSRPRPVGGPSRCPTPETCSVRRHLWTSSSAPGTAARNLPPRTGLRESAREQPAAEGRDGGRGTEVLDESREGGRERSLVHHSEVRVQHIW